MDTVRRPVRGSRRRRSGNPLFGQILTAAVESAAETVAIRSNPTGDSAHARELTYREFDEASSRLARELIERGIGPGDIVAIGIGRSIESVLAVWAIAKTGAAYVPVDPAYPADRIAHMIADSGAVLGLTTVADRGALGDGVPWLELDEPEVAEGIAVRASHPISYTDRVRLLTEQHPAYVIYTSGSTGRPKGVVVTHTGLATVVNAMREHFGVGGDSRVMHICSPNFDVSVLELMLAFSSGATLVVSPPKVFGGFELADLIARERVTHMLITPGALESVDPAGLDTLAVVAVIGDRFGPELVGRWARDGRAFYNTYGPTEATILDTASGALQPGEPITIGAPITGIGAFVLDSRLRPVPAGVVGELYLSGQVLAQGYLGRPGLTAGRFVASPFGADAGQPGTRLYRTGDLVRRNESDGSIEFLGRSDFQVKVRGFRIELGEIDNALTAHPDLDYAVTLGKVLPSGVTTLVSYVLPRPASTVDTGELVEFISKSLPAYMIPTTIIVLDEIPLSPIGKLDRARLPEPEFATRDFRAPSTPAEEVVAEVFAALLIPAGAEGHGRVGADDDFFELGGNSLLAAQAAARIGSALDVRVPVQLLFEAATVSVLAERVERYADSAAGQQLRAMERPDRVPLSYAQQRMWFLNRFDPGSAVNNIPVAVRLSGRLDVDALRAAVRDVVTRHEVLRTVYPEVDGEGRQVVLPVSDVRAVPELSVVESDEAGVLELVARVVTEGFDVTAEPPVRLRLIRVGAAAAAPERSAGIGVSSGRTGLGEAKARDGYGGGLSLVWSSGANDEPETTDVEVATGEFVLVCVVHHIAGDGFSMGPLTRDLMTAYVERARGSEPGWAPLDVQYADYALWQREVLGAEEDPESLLARQIAFWRSELAGLPEQLELPMDSPRPVVSSNEGAAFAFGISAEVHAGLNRVAQEHNATLFMVVHAALAVLLARLSGSRDIAVGTPIAGRGEADLDELIGMFVNTLVLRSPVDPGVPFGELLTAVRASDIAAFGHADVPFERLVELLEPVRSTARHPLFQVMLSFQNLTQPRFELPDLSVSVPEFDTGLSKFDLQLTLGEQLDDQGEAQGMAASFTYATDLFDEATVRDFAARFGRVLAAVAADAAVVVGDIDVLAPGEQELVLHEWNSPGVLVPPLTVPELIAEQSRRRPDAAAIRYSDLVLSFDELQRGANRVARALIERGVGPETLVAVAMPRTEELAVALLGVLVAGAGYLPIDTTLPAQRLEFMLTDANPACVLTTSQAREALPDTDVPVLLLEECESFDDAAVEDADRVSPLRPQNLAYVIYTSGSTGVPKAVAVPHATVLELFANTQSLFDFRDTDVWTQFHSYAFDFSVWELWCALANGGTVVMVDYLTSRSPELFRELLIRERVTVLSQTPSAFYQLAEADRTAQSATEGESGNGVGDLALRYAVLGGESLDLQQLQRWYDRHAPDAPQVMNGYGPTETTVFATFFAVDERSADIPASVIGRALPGLEGYVLDDRLHAAPVGVAGEIYIAGKQLTRGYLGRPGLAATRFVANPFGEAGSRMYRTGDLGRWAGFEGEAALEYAGRGDQQVQLRGFRIELGEIESALGRCEGVSQSVVVVHSDEHAGDRLVGYVVPEAGSELDSAELRRRVADFLTAYMVPDVVMVLEALPLTPNGKLDRRALPAPEFAGSAVAFRAPGTPIEQAVADVFAGLLGAERVGLDDDFFALGGNSLLATRAVARVNEALDANTAVRELFEASTVAGLAARIVPGAAAGTARPRLTPAPRTGLLPLSLAQQRMWVINQLDPESPSYNIPLAIRLTGELDVEALRAAVGDVLERHESLRTRYPADGLGGLPYQQILSAAEALPAGLTVESGGDPIARIGALMSTGFDVSQEVPVRALLLEQDRDYLLAMVVHHISADGASLAPLARDLVTAYVARAQGGEPGWAPLEIQYADYAVWQREVIGDDGDENSVAARQLDYWRDRLAVSPARLATDRPRPVVPSLRGAYVGFTVDASVHERLTRIAGEHNSSLFMVVHAALAAVLAGQAESSDIVIGTPIAGRGERALDDLVGMFVNTLALRTTVEASDTFAALVDKARESDLSAFANSDIPFERVAEAVATGADPFAAQRLLQVVLSFQNNERPTLELPGLTIAAVDTDAVAAKFDLQVNVEPHYDADGAPADLVAVFTYATDLFDESTVRRLGERFERILTAVAVDPELVVGAIELPTSNGEVGAALDGAAHDIVARDDVALDGGAQGVAALDGGGQGVAARDGAVQGVAAHDGTEQGAGAHDGVAQGPDANDRAPQGAGPDADAVPGAGGDDGAAHDAAASGASAHGALTHERVAESAPAATESAAATVAATKSTGTALAQVLAGIVEEDPDSPALVSGGDEVSYRELDARSSRLARVLIGRGCGPGVGVAVRLDRGIDATVATWAVLKAGAAVIPVGADMVLPTASGADTVPGIEVGLAALAPVPAEHLDGIDWVVLSDPAVMSEIAAESARPVTYANRIGALRGTDPAFVAEHRVLGYDELAVAVDGLRSGTELTFESRTFHQGPPGALAALLEILGAGAAGASMVLPAEGTAAALAEEWVTHLFTDHDGLARLDPEPLEDLQALVLDRGPEPVSGFGAAETIMVLDELVG